MIYFQLYLVLKKNILVMFLSNGKNPIAMHDFEVIDEKGILENNWQMDYSSL